MTYLLDTNVVSELRKGERANPLVASWFAELADDEVFLSVLTLGEIRRGIESLRSRDPKSAATLDSWFGRLSEIHQDRILPLTKAVAEEWGRMSALDPVPVVDCLLAATAKVAGLVLATRNTRDIAGTGVDFLDPFAALPA